MAQNRSEFGIAAHWHEIFLMTAAMLRSADSLMQLMKQQIDALVAKDPYLQDFLVWASQKAKLPTQTREAMGRAFYLALAKTPHQATAIPNSTLYGRFSVSY